MMCKEKKIGFLGPWGTNTEEAAQCYLGHELNSVLVPYATIDAVIRAVDCGAVESGVIPIENSIEGAVNVTVDMLVHEVALFITHEIVKPIKHHLLVNRVVKAEQGFAEEIKVILSKDQALAQCRHYLQKYYPHAQVKAVDSTAYAAAVVAGDAPGCAAIGSLKAAEIHGLKVAASEIQDSENNCTRFVVISKKQLVQGKGKYKTTLVSKINGQRAGSLCDLLQEFAERNVNLTKIESRPARTGLGEYIFLFDIEGGTNDSNIGAAVEAVKEKSIWFKNLGSYLCIEDNKK